MANTSGGSRDEEPSKAARALARNILAFRKRSGLTQAKLAEGAGVPRRTLVTLEDTGRGSTRSIERIADFFGVGLATLFESDPDTADAMLFAAQYDLLTERGKEVFHRVLASKAADDKIRPEDRRDRRED